MAKVRERTFGQMPDDSVWHGLMLERALELVRTRDLTAEQIAERTGVSSHAVRKMLKKEGRGNAS